MKENLVGMVSEVLVGIKRIATGAAEISTGNIDLSSRTEEQAASLEETTASMEELTSTVKQNADNAHQGNQLAREAAEAASRGTSLALYQSCVNGSRTALRRWVICSSTPSLAPPSSAYSAGSIERNTVHCSVPPFQLS